MHRLVIGTYTEHMPHVRGEGKGVYFTEFLPASGRIKQTGLVSGPRNPSFVALSPGGRRLYAVQETFEKDSPGLWAYAVDEDGSNAKFLGSVPALGGEPCHVSLDPKGRFVLLANYGGGNAVCYPLGKNGEIVNKPTVIQHTGSGPHTRQDRARVHSIHPDREAAHVLVCDLGTDVVASYALTDAGLANDKAVSLLKVAPASGPRQLTFTPDGSHIIVIDEFTGYLDRFAYDRGKLTHKDRAPTLPADWTGENIAAAVVVHPNGKFGYASNRGHDSVVTFACAADQPLKAIAWQREGVEFSRDIAIDPTGQYLLVANQNRGDVVTFAIDPASGALKATGEVFRVPSPTCLAFVR